MKTKLLFSLFLVCTLIVLPCVARAGKIMIFGAGETSEKTARSFRSRGAQQIFVSNQA